MDLGLELFDELSSFGGGELTARLALRETHGSPGVSEI